MKDEKLDELYNLVLDTNKQRDENIVKLKMLFESESLEPRDRISILKTIDDTLKSKENSLLNNIKASLLNKDVNVGVDYKRAAIDMLKTIAPNNTPTGTVKVDSNVADELEKILAKTDLTISDNELVLEDD